MLELAVQAQRNTEVHMRKLVVLASVVALSGLHVHLPAVAQNGPAQKANQLPLRFKDANGTVVGRPIWMKAQYAVLTVERTTFAGLLRPYSNGGGEDYSRSQFQLDILYFSTPDCNGQAYRILDESIVGVAPATLQATKDGHLLAFVASGNVVTVDINSFRSGQFDCASSSGREIVVPVSDTPIDITGRFVPPFTMR